MKDFIKYCIALLPAVLIVASVSVWQGCKSTQLIGGPVPVQTDTNGVLSVGGTVIQPAAAGIALKMGAVAGARALIQKNPDSRQYLAIAAGVINAAIANQTYDPTTLQTALQTTINPSGGNSAQIRAAISDGLSLYSLFYAQVVDAKLNNASPYLKPCLQGLADGITKALVSE